MRILVINPNTTASMTRSIGLAAEQAASAGTTIVAMNPRSGPPSIQGAEDGLAALPGLFELFDRAVTADGPYDAVVIACFDDTGLTELRSRSPVPVVGIGEAAYHRAAEAGAPFSVITTMSVSIPVLTANIEAYGLATLCAAVRASEVPVLELEADADAAQARIEEEIAVALAEDHCRSIVLGCAGMAEMARQLQQKYERPVIEGISAAIASCEAYAATGKPRFMDRLAS